MNKIVIQGGRLIDPSTETDCPGDLAIENGFIVGVGRAPAGFVPDLVVPAQGCIVSPGLVDLAARLREPGLEYRATLESELQAAVAGGVTHLACPPDTEPALDEPGLVEMLKHRARTLRLAHVYPVGALTKGLAGDSLTEMNELTDAGCVGFSQATAPMIDTRVLMRALQYASTFDYCVWLHPIDPFLNREGVAHDGALAARLGLAGVPVASETLALHRIFDLMRVTGARVHLCRISSAEGVNLVRRAKFDGLPVTCDVGVHHLHLTDMDLGWFNPQMRIDPPLREQRDRDAIRAGLIDGTIDAICSDHTPVDDDAKHLPFDEAEPGATGLELLYALVYKWAIEAQVPLARALAKVTCTPATRLGLDVGRMTVGASADIAVFDPEQRWVVDASALVSQGRNSPYLGYELPGQVLSTWVSGRPVFQRVNF